MALTVNGSIARAAAVTPSDTALLPNGERTRGVYVGATGDVVAVMAEGGNTVTFAGAAGGITHPWSVIQIKSTGTSATGIVAVYE